MKKFVQNHLTSLCLSGLLAACFIIFFWENVFITIQSGERGIKYSRFFGGTILEKSYKEGLHIMWPWDRMFLYDVRLQEESQDVNVLTLEGLPVKVQVSMKYQLSVPNLPKLHIQVGQEYRKKVIEPLITSAVRQTIGSYRPTELYSKARQELQDTMLVSAIEEMGRIPIIIHTMVVKNVTMPMEFTEAVIRKLVAEQNLKRYQYLVYEAQQEAKRRAIEAEGVRYYQTVVNENMTGSFLRYEGIKATKELATSQNAKMVVIGGKDGMPLILNTPSDTQEKQPEVKLPQQESVKQPSVFSEAEKNKKTFFLEEQKKRLKDFFKRMDGILMTDSMLSYSESKDLMIGEKK